MTESVVTQVPPSPWSTAIGCDHLHWLPGLSPAEANPSMSTDSCVRIKVINMTLTFLSIWNVIYWCPIIITWSLFCNMLTMDTPSWRVSCQKGPIWVGPFWQDTLELTFEFKAWDIFYEFSFYEFRVWFSSYILLCFMQYQDYILSLGAPFTNLV